MKTKLLLLQFVLFVLIGALGSAWAQQDSATPDQTTPDNTKVNQRDRNKSQPTADQQKENNSDRELARQVRRALVQDKTLSTYAHNVKVVAQNGMVTLKGPVRSDQEKQAVESKAAEIAGADKVTNQIEVKSK
jgi:hyperosmotically inducible periplasmic protein